MSDDNCLPPEVGDRQPGAFLVGSHLQEDMCLFSDHSVLIQGSVYIVDWDRGLEGGGFNVVLSDKVPIHNHASGAQIEECGCGYGSEGGGCS